MEAAGLRWLRHLLSHFERVARLHVEIVRLRRDAAWHGQILDRLDYPILLVDDTGLISMCNRAAEAWQAANSSFCIRRMRLVGRSKGTQSLLERLLQQVIRSRKCATQILPHPDGGKPYQMIALPLVCPNGTACPPQQTLSLIILGDPQANTSLSIEAMQALFGFTLAEARVTTGICQGRTPEEVSRDIGVSINTVRSQLRHVLEKTGSCRQTELLRIVTTLPRLKR